MLRIEHFNLLLLICHIEHVILGFIASIMELIWVILEIWLICRWMKIKLETGLILWCHLLNYVWVRSLDVMWA